VVERVTVPEEEQTMKYMLIIYADPAHELTPGTPEFDERRAQWMAVSTDMGPVYESGAALQPIDTATTVRADAPGGDPVLTDGPYAETKEFLAGYYVVDVPDLDTATQWAARLPLHPGGSVEVRPVVELPAA
jgi:hypothetical protein